jgi:hypothetical protein
MHLKIGRKVPSTDPMTVLSTGNERGQKYYSFNKNGIDSITAVDRLAAIYIQEILIPQYNGSRILHCT